MTRHPGGTTPPLPSFLISSERCGDLWTNCSFGAFFLLSHVRLICHFEASHLQTQTWCGKSFLTFLFSLSVQKAALDCDTTRTNSKFHLLPSFTKTVFTDTVGMVSFQRNRSWLSLSMLLDEQPESSLFHHLQFKMKRCEAGSRSLFPET